MAPKRTITIAPYDPTWPATFAALSQVIADALGDLHLRIEHVGSTAVPRLGAKPIIDLDVVIASRDLLPAVVDALAPLGYRHNGDQDIPTREAFRRADERVPRVQPHRTWMAHNLYVCALDSPELARHLAFRDFLRANPQLAKAYERLKRDLARRHRFDGEAYCDAKSEFILGVLRRAMGET